MEAIVERACGPLRALRDLVRARRKLIESRTTEQKRLLKLLETANVKLASVVSDVFGVSGLRMLRALAAGEADPATLANEARGSLRGKHPALMAALTGRIEPHHRVLLTLHLDRLDQLATQVGRLTAVIDDHLAPYAAAHARLQQIPGVGPEVAAVLLAELGDDMTVFGDAHHVAAWVGICPGNNESAGNTAAPQQSPSRRGLATWGGSGQRPVEDHAAMGVMARVRRPTRRWSRRQRTAPLITNVGRPGSA